MIRINQIKLNIAQSEKNLEPKIRKLLRLKDSDIFEYEIVKKSIDARHNNCLMYVYSVDVSFNVKLPENGLTDSENLTDGEIKKKEEKLVTRLNNKNIMSITRDKYTFPSPLFERDKKIVIAGSGPAGLFCGLFLARAGYSPVIYERGESVRERSLKVRDFWENGVLDVRTNVQFGEGGAGTFSDGKLNTAVREKSGRIRKVLETFVEFGAPREILYINKPHIGTDILEKIVYNIRREIERLGGKVFFNSQVTDVYIKNGRIRGLELNGDSSVDCDRLVLALGHSARDSFEMLRDAGLIMEPKPFAVGMRIEHPQEMINRYAYKNASAKGLPVADYKVTAQTAGGRGVYSFCMCPGGYVVNASSEEGHICVNGMSYSGRGGINANSAIVVTVGPADFGQGDELRGVAFQRKLEAAVYLKGHGAVLQQLNGDFISDRKSNGFGRVVPQLKGKGQFGSLREVLPEFICESVIDGMKSFDKIISGFNMPDAVWSGVESRTSSPVRMIRNENLESMGIKGIYPCGEGAGYAGGITSAAVDGIKVAEAIASSVG